MRLVLATFTLYLLPARRRDFFVATLRVIFFGALHVLGCDTTRPLRGPLVQRYFLTVRFPLLPQVPTTPSVISRKYMLAFPSAWLVESRYAFA